MAKQTDSDELLAAKASLAACRRELWVARAKWDESSAWTGPTAARRRAHVGNWLRAVGRRIKRAEARVMAAGG